ncbi:MAG: VanW family protein [Actinomycetota bacterium]|nr:VanW family protein [Actinomycetota bacterium]
MSVFETTETGPATGPERAGGRLVIVVVLGLVILLGAAWTAAYLGAGDKVPRGTTIAGVDVGGLEQQSAADELEAGLADRVDEPITVTVGDREETVLPSEAGIGVDYAASVAAAGGEESWSPSRLWDYYTGGDDLEPVVTVDDAAMQATIDRLTRSVGTPAENGSWSFAKGQVKETDPVVGRGIDPEAARSAILAAYLTDDANAELTLTDLRPAIDEDDMRAARDSFVNPARSAPVTLLFSDSEVQLRPRDYLGVLRLEPVDGELVPGLDTDRLKTLVDASTSADGKPVDATVRLVNGKPKVIPAKPGVTYDPADLADVFLDLVASEGKREAKVKATVDPADFTTKEARALKIREQVSTFTTYFPYAEYRNTNIGRAAELINGTVLEPGEEFSLNETVGERTAENGFVPGFIISDGIFKEDYGGGVSQIATTTFNAMFFAGLKDIEHKPHSFYIDRYPVGREATVAWGAVDLRFQNDTPYGVLVDAHVTPSTPSSQGVVTVRMFSTKYWDITTETSDRYAYVSPETRVLRTPDCYPNSGYSGFQVDVWRYFRKHGESELDHEEKFHTSYTPSDTVICKPPKSDD